MVHQVGIIGLGIMGQRMLRMMSGDDRFSVVIGMDHDVAQMEALSKDYPDIQMVQDAIAVASHPELDLVYVATPPTTHVTYANLALDHDKAVLCEKPLSVDLDEAEQLVQRVKASNITNAINFPLATSSSVEYLENALRSGEFGDPLRVDIYCHFSQWPRVWQQGAGSWLSESVEGGYVREVVSHFMYLAHRLFGDIEVVSSQVTYPDEQSSESNVIAVMDAGNTTIRLVGGVGGNAPDVIDFTIYGTKTSYRLRNWRDVQKGTLDAWYDVEIDSAISQPHLDAIANMIGGSAYPLADFAMGLQVQKTIEAILS